MAKTDKADKAKEEARQELEKAKIEAAKLKDIFASEWNEVVERSLKDQNDVTINQSQHVRMKSADKKERNQQILSREGESYGQKLRSQVAKMAWSIARDTGYIHVSLAKTQQYEEALATVKEAIGMSGTLHEVVEKFQQTEA